MHKRLVDDHGFHFFFLFVVLVGLLMLVFRLLVLFYNLFRCDLYYLLLFLLGFLSLLLRLLGKLFDLFQERVLLRFLSQHNVKCDLRCVVDVQSWFPELKLSVFELVLRRRLLLIRVVACLYGTILFSFRCGLHFAFHHIRLLCLLNDVFSARCSALLHFVSGTLCILRFTYLKFSLTGDLRSIILHNRVNILNYILGFGLDCEVH